MSSHDALQILKIGGSVITDRRTERPFPLREAMSRIAGEIAEALPSATFRLVIVHGAGSFGHPIVSRTGIDKGIFDPGQRMAMGETQRLQNRLNAFFVSHLLRAGLPVFPFQASASALMDRGRFVSMDVSALEEAIRQGMIPVLYGVPSFDRTRGCSILSGDAIASFLFVKLAAAVILHATNVRGVFTSDPSEDPAAQFLETVDLRGIGILPAGIGGSRASDVTGGLRRKLEEMSRVKAPGQVFDAGVPGHVRRALCGETVGTQITC